MLLMSCFFISLLKLGRIKKIYSSENELNLNFIKTIRKTLQKPDRAKRKEWNNYKKNLCSDNC